MAKNCQKWPKTTENENFEFRDEKIKVVEEVLGVISIYITYTFGQKISDPPLPPSRKGGGVKNFLRTEKIKVVEEVSGVISIYAGFLLVLENWKSL